MPIARPRPSSGLRFDPVTPDRVADLERFSAEYGKFGYCSCMRWRMTSTEFRRSSRPERADALTALALGREAVGILAYHDDLPIGWCSIAPRQSYAALERYRALPRIDDRAVWSVVCFFVSSRYRRQGITLDLLKAAVDYAASEGASIVEGYPVEPSAPSYTYMGSPDTFRKAGFDDVTPDGQARIVMRRRVGYGDGEHSDEG